MRIDDRQLNELITESQDLQVDAMRDNNAMVSDLRDLRADRGDVRPTLEERQAFDDSRRSLLKKFGLGAGAYAGKAAFAGGLGAAVTSVLATPANAQQPMDIQILQTAASLEILAVATYEAALGLDFIANGNPVLVTFAETTMMQHDEHGMAFNAQASALGGMEREEPNPVYAQVVQDAMPGLTDPLAVVKLAMQLEEVASDTYLEDLTLFEDSASIDLTGSIMGVEVQHLATLVAVGALLEADAGQFIAIPTDLANLPAVAGSVALQEPFLTTSEETVAAPESGAVS